MFYCKGDEKLEKKLLNEVKKFINKTRLALIICFLLIFSVLSMIVYSVAERISSEMSQSAIENLSESLDLIQGTIQVILNKEAEFQKLLAREISLTEDPVAFIQSYDTNTTMVKISIVPSGEYKGISNNGEQFSAAELDFSAGNTVDGLPISSAYVNDMGTWAYTMKCQVMQEGRETSVLYIEYIYDSFEKALPEKFYNGSASRYVMDVESERFVLKPKGIREREAGHIDLQDFYRANQILEEEIHENVSQSIAAGENIMFYHEVRKKDSLIFVWSVNEGAIYLIGYVPIEAIQREGDAVNQNILIVVFVMLMAFFGCCVLYFINNRQQYKIRKEREAEREMHQKQLAEALQAAQIASSSKTTFLSNMSHDIRTPMNAILGFTTLLAKDADNPVKVREYTKKITSSGQHLLSLINDVLDVSKIESGKVVLTIGEFTLKDMVSAVDAIIRPMAKERRQEFDVTVSGIQNENLVGDETRLNQVLINLLSNSVKYTPEGGSIWMRIIGLEQRSSQYEHIRIEVQDNGYGMTPEYLAVIFDAFTRAENSTTNKVQGTGLGMAITKNIVELMGGTISVSSEVDKGSLFTVDLELRIADGKTDEEFWKENGIVRILTVDDEEDIGRNIQMLMEDVGVHCDMSLSGEDAIRLVKETYEKGNYYNVILLDWKMPGMDGIETAREIRKIIPNEVPILFLTSYDLDEVQEKAVDAGIDGFMSKPFFVSAFREKILEVTDKHATKEQDQAEEDFSLAGQFFLVAEDNEVNSEILRELLGMEGASCEIAENGQIALECFWDSEAGKFDAILMDVQMPIMNGYEATKAIRQLEREDAKTIPIIAMTANAFAEDVKEAKEAGMNEHIAKPIDMGIVKRTLGKYLKEKESV